MIGDREQVYENIRTAVSLNQLNSKVEPGDPKLLREDKEALLRHYIDYRTAYGFCVKKYIAEAIFHAGTFAVGLITQVDGLENLSGIRGPAIVTCNHFSPLDPAIVRFAMRKAGFTRMSIVNQDTNLAMKGFVGYMQRYADTMPVSSLKWFMETEFPNQIKNALDENKLVLIYPEQEMWFNYRKPRPPKRGAYFYAAKFNVPIISCFVEMKDMDKDDTEEFKRVKYVLHILDPIYPDPEKNERDNSFDMMKKDYEQKKAAYEQIYKRPLDYAFSDSDIAGWKGTTE